MKRGREDVKWGRLMLRNKDRKWKKVKEKRIRDGEIKGKRDESWEGNKEKKIKVE